MQMPLPTLVQTAQVAGSLGCSGKVVLGPAIPTSRCLSTSSFHSLEPSQLLLCPGQVWQVWLLWIPRLPPAMESLSFRQTHSPASRAKVDFLLDVCHSILGCLGSELRIGRRLTP